MHRKVSYQIKLKKPVPKPEKPNRECNCPESVFQPPTLIPSYRPSAHSSRSVQVKPTRRKSESKQRQKSKQKQKKRSKSTKQKKVVNVSKKKQQKKLKFKVIKDRLRLAQGKQFELAVRLRNLKLYSPKSTQRSSQIRPWNFNYSNPKSANEEVVQALRSKIKKELRKSKSLSSLAQKKRVSRRRKHSEYLNETEQVRFLDQLDSHSQQEDGGSPISNKNEADLRLEMFQKYALKQILKIQRFYRKRQAKKRRVNELLSSKLKVQKGVKRVPPKQRRDGQTQSTERRESAVCTVDIQSNEQCSQTIGEELAIEEHNMLLNQIDQLYTRQLQQLEVQFAEVKSRNEAANVKIAEQQTARLKEVCQPSLKEGPSQSKKVQLQICSRVEQMQERGFIYERDQGFPTNLHVLTQFLSCVEKFVQANYFPEVLQSINVFQGASLRTVLKNCRGVAEPRVAEEMMLNEAMFEDFQANVIQPPSNEKEAKQRVLERYHNLAMFNALSQKLQEARPWTRLAIGLPTQRWTLIDQAKCGAIFEREINKIIEGSCLAGLLIESEHTVKRELKFEEVYENEHNLPKQLFDVRKEHMRKLLQLEKGSQDRLWEHEREQQQFATGVELASIIEQELFLEAVGQLYRQ